MNTLIALSTLVNLANAAAALIAQVTKISEVVKKAQDEGRDITTEELDSITAADDAAKAALNDAISKHGG